MYLILRNSKGQETGRLRFRLTILAQAQENDRAVTVQLFVDEIHARWLSSFTGGTTSIKFTPECVLNDKGGECQFDPSVSGPITLNTASGAPVTIKLRSNQPVNGSTNPLAIMQGMMSVAHSYSTSAPGSLPVGVLRFGQVVRCDSANLTQPAYRTPACIFTNAQPVLNFNINDASINESAQHIRDAQANPAATKPLPPDGGAKTIPSPLTRHWDSVLNSDQRAKSVATCRDEFGPTPEGKDCDEFPFASTYEGSLQPPNPNYDFSVRYISSGDNRRSGCWFGKWYVKDRILQGDQFTVHIFDGPTVTQEDPLPTDCGGE